MVQNQPRKIVCETPITKKGLVAHTNIIKKEQKKRLVEWLKV
jgi:hypothetical protein